MGCLWRRLVLFLPFLLPFVVRVLFPKRIVELEGLWADDLQQFAAFWA